MSNGQQGVIHSATEGGISGTHPAADPFELLVAPATSSEFNTARLRLIPIACWKVEDIRFAFDSSFVTSDITTELKELVALRERHKKTDLLARNVQYPPLSVFGHADPEGSDDYNKALSGRRATVIYALLISNAEPGKAVSLWSSVARQENWGADHRQAMQAATGLPAGTPDAQLVHTYLQKLSPKELSLTPKDFLAQGADSGGKGDYQGCSRFNPLLIFSQQKEDEFKKADRDKDQSGVVLRNVANSPNRRVMVLLFRPDSKVDPAKWPCPRATEGAGGCIKRFFSDGQRRRSSRLPETDRKFDDTKDTFACRFYHRLLTNSPCEKFMALVQIRLFDRQARPLPGAPCLITEPGKDPRPARASGTGTNPAPIIPPVNSESQASSAPAGDATQDAFITIRDLTAPAAVNVKWSRPKSGDGPNSPLPTPTDAFEYEMDVVIDIPQDDADKASLTRLKNLGYVQGPAQPEDIRAFQLDYKPRFGAIVVDGTLNAATKNAVKSVHDACDSILKGPRNTPL